MMMMKKLWTFQCLAVICFCSAVRSEGVVAQEKAEAINPIPITSPPEGNTTFLGGTTWCVARPGASQVDLQIALDWACGLGAADCSPIQASGPCFDPDTLVSHASYAFNTYYQQNGNNDVACNFGGTAMLTKNNPSYAKCDYAASGPVKSASAPSPYQHKTENVWLRPAIVLLLLYLGS